MHRREFLRTLGAAGAVFSLLDVIPLRAATNATGAPRTSRGQGGPFDLDFDPSGHLLATYPAEYRVLKLDKANTPVAGFGRAGAEVGSLNFPKGLAVDSAGLVYVVDANNGRVQVFSSEAFRTLQAPDTPGSGGVEYVIGSIGAIGGSFSTPQGVHVADDGRILVADTRNHRIQIFKDRQLTAVLGELGDADDQFRLPTAVSLTSDRDMVVLDGKHALVKIFGPDLKFKRAFGGNGTDPGRLNRPQGMKISRDGHIWIADTGNHRIQEFAPDGTFLSGFGKQGSGEGEFNGPTGLALKDDRIYVADNGNSRIQVIAKKTR
ncbi:MAG: NHL repeat-containing protein [Thermodesulfobacteriota bacterium]